jgi:Anti-sigma-K factor rskA/Putative zinc-finger
MRARGAGLHTLVGAYVMDAVSEADRVSFERHLLTCEQCRDDVRGLREAAARLGTAEAVRPRPELREQTMQAAARIRQQPPLLPDQSHLPLTRRRGIAGRWQPGSVRAGTHPWLARAALTAAVALAATATVFGLHLSSMQSKLSAAEQRDTAIATVLGARDATTLTAKVTTGGMATVVMSHRERALVFIASGLTRLPAAQAYELWLMSPAGDTPAGMLPPARRGMSGPMVVYRLGPGEQLAMTVEPVSGSHQPTSVPVVLVALGG